MSIQLSARLQFIANLITQNASFADIGSDHAYLPTYVCLRDKDANAIAGEVVQGPYESALQTVKKHNLHHRIDVRLGSGLDVISIHDRITEIVIAGMGGTLIANILLDGKGKLRTIDRLILQPNNNEMKVRQVLLKLGFVLTEEYILEENNLIYEILVAERKEITKAKEPYKLAIKDKQLWFGPFLSEERSPVFVKKWRNEKDKLMKTIEQMERSKSKDVQVKIKSFRQKISWIQEVIS